MISGFSLLFHLDYGIYVKLFLEFYLKETARSFILENAQFTLIYNAVPVKDCYFLKEKRDIEIESVPVTRNVSNLRPMYVSWFILA